MAEEFFNAHIETGRLASQLRARAAAYRRAKQELRTRLQDVKDIYYTAVKQIVYIQSPEPVQYQRTMNLLNSVRMTPVQAEDGAISVRIDFDKEISPARYWPGSSYSVYVVQPLRKDTGFLKHTRTWTTDWRKYAYDQIIQHMVPILNHLAKGTL